MQEISIERMVFKKDTIKVLEATLLSREKVETLLAKDEKNL